MKTAAIFLLPGWSLFEFGRAFFKLGLIAVFFGNDSSNQSIFNDSGITRHGSPLIKVEFGVGNGLKS